MQEGRERQSVVYSTRAHRRPERARFSKTSPGVLKDDRENNNVGGEISLKTQSRRGRGTKIGKDALFLLRLSRGEKSGPSEHRKERKSGIGHPK